MDTLAPHAVATVHVVGTTTPVGFPFTSTLSNSAKASASNQASQTAQAAITVVSPNVAIEKTADNETINAGGEAGFVVTIVNNGKGTAKGVTLNDPLPPLGGDHSWIIDGGANALAFVITGVPGKQILELASGINTLAPGQQLTVHISGKTGRNRNFVDALHNLATVDAINEATHNQQASATIAITAVLPPQELKGIQRVNEFATQEDRINSLTWEAPHSGNTPVSYLIYRDHKLRKLLAVVPADHHRHFKYDDHNRKEGKTETYFIVSVDQFDNQSQPASVTVRRR